ncbi:MAG: HlyD family efflux transporter periplasmic adaptor subunit [Saprospiraceae bacterium]
MEAYDNIELHSEDVQEILSTPPRWIVRWGTLIVFFTILSLGFLSWLIKYPDMISTKITISSAEPAIPVISSSEGYLSQLLVKDGAAVERGNILAVMQNTAQYGDVMYLDSVVNLAQTSTETELNALQLRRNLTLGEIQDEFSEFIRLFESLKLDKKVNPNSISINNFRQQIKKKERTIRNKKSAILQLKNDLRNAAANFEQLREEYPRNPSVENSKKLKQARDNKLTIENEIYQVEAEIVDIYPEIEALKADILNIQRGNITTNQGKFILLKNEINSLKNSIYQWKQKYLLTAKIDGIASFHTIRNEQQYLERGDEVMAIVPVGLDSLLGKILLDVKGAGRVVEGQTVRIKFDGFPYEEFGAVIGKVANKSLVPRDNKYFIEVELVDGLNTSFGKKVPYNVEMNGLAEIVREEKRVIEFVFEKFLAFVDSYVR